EQVEQTCICRAKTAFERVGRRIEHFGDLSRILKTSRSKYDKADLVSAAATGATGHSLTFAGAKRTPAIVSAPTGVHYDGGSRGKIDTRGDRRCGKDRIQQTGRHHLFDQKFPGRNVAGMVRADARVHQKFAVFMIYDLRIFLCKFVEDLAAEFKLFGICLLRSVGGGRDGGFVAFSA